MSNSTHQFLNEIKLFQDLPKDQIMDLLRTLRPVRYQPSEMIFKKGDEGHAAFVVQEGCVEIFVSNPRDSLVITRFQSGEVFGELALIDNAPRSASARALTPCEILCIDKRVFDQLRLQMRPLAYTLLRRLANELCKRIRETNEQIEDLLIHGRLEQRGGTAVTSARTVEPEPEETGMFSRFISLFK